MRPFTEKERQVIDRDLKLAGKELFTTHGWKKTGIDDLCRAAGIARGTFYHFYESKDAFFLQLLADAEAAVKQELFVTLTADTSTGPEILETFLDACLGLIDRHPLLRFAFADPKEPAPWLRALDGESLEVLTNGDDETARQVFALLAQKGLVLGLSPAVFAGLLRGLVLLPLSRRTIGEGVYEQVKGTLASALARGLS